MTRILYIVLLLSGLAATKEIKCNLQWVSITSEDTIPLGAISMSDAQPALDFIVRFQTSEGVWAGGRIDEKKIAYAVVNGQMESSHMFEILSNPFECKIKWGQTVGPLTVAFETGMYVGRVYSGSSMLGGYVDDSLVLNYVDHNLNVQQNAREKQIMEASSDGLIAKVYGFQMNSDDLQPSTEFLGIDTINNQSPAIVRQNVTHKKKLLQTLQVQETSSKGNFGDIFSSVSMSVQLDFPGGGGPVMDLSRSGSNGGEPISTTIEKEIVTERQIDVSPNTAVYICSTLTVMENFQADYTARAEATAPGLSATEIGTILIENGESGWEIQEGKMIKEIKGTMSGTAALNSQFIVSPTSAKTGCPQISALVYKAKKLKRSISNGNMTLKEYTDLNETNSKVLKLLNQDY